MSSLNGYNSVARFGINFKIVLHQTKEKSQLLLISGPRGKLDCYNHLGGHVESFSVDTVSEILHCLLKEHTLAARDVDTMMLKPPLVSTSKFQRFSSSEASMTKMSSI